MKKHRIAAVCVFLQAVALPVAFGSRGIFVQALLTVLSVAVFLGKKWAVWTALVLMCVQIPVVESRTISWHVGSGTGLSVGALTGASFLDSRLGLNRSTGYFFNSAIVRAPLKRLLTDGKDILGAYMLNLAVLPAAFLLFAVMRAASNRASVSPPTSPPRAFDSPRRRA